MKCMLCGEPLVFNTDTYCIDCQVEDTEDGWDYDEIESDDAVIRSLLPTINDAFARYDDWVAQYR